MVVHDQAATELEAGKCRKRDVGTECLLYRVVVLYVQYSECQKEAKEMPNNRIELLTFA